MTAAITMATTNMAKAKGTATTIIATEAIRDIIKHIETQEKQALSFRQRGAGFFLDRPKVL